MAEPAENIVQLFDEQFLTPAQSRMVDDFYNDLSAFVFERGRKLNGSAALGVIELVAAQVRIAMQENA